ncbi:hypothetical protein KKC00_01705 [Patescibacteria group bacterium]|nr:hypothetical protein [Patescibacteria group bacterium]
MNIEKKRIIFPDEADAVVLEIVRKYKLKEELFPDAVITGLTRNLLQEKIPEKKFGAFLKNELKVAQQTAKKIAEEVKNNVIPLLEMVPESQFVFSPTENPVKEAEKEIEEELMAMEKAEIETGEETEEKIEPIKQTQIAQPLEEKPITEPAETILQTNEPKKEDKYKEAID